MQINVDRDIDTYVISRVKYQHGHKAPKKKVSSVL